MTKFGFQRSVLCVASVASLPLAHAQDADPFQVNAAVQGIWDGNFSRSPLNDSEQGVLSSAGFRFDDTFGRQRLIAKWDLQHYAYDVHPDFDATTDKGQLSWRGAFADKLTSDIDFQRNAYQVDRLEFFGKDIVTRDDLTAKLGYGTDNRLSVHAGARKSTQEHSNTARNSLDFEEQEGFADVGLQTSTQSNIYLRYKSGDRTYSNPIADVTNPTAVVDLDFNYQQLELDAQWTLTPKTILSTLLARYQRDGAINDANGSVASIALEWRATEKINISSGYTLNEPALGETSDAPSRIKTVSLAAQWQFANKWSLNSALAYSTIDYAKLSAAQMREEKLYAATPLAITFDSGRHWKLRVDTSWRKNESPIYARQYLARQINAGIYAYF